MPTSPSHPIARFPFAYAESESDPAPGGGPEGTSAHSPRDCRPAGLAAPGLPPRCLPHHGPPPNLPPSRAAAPREGVRLPYPGIEGGFDGVRPRTTDAARRKAATLAGFVSQVLGHFSKSNENRRSIKNEQSRTEALQQPTGRVQSNIERSAEDLDSAEKKAPQSFVSFAEDLVAGRRPIQRQVRAARRRNRLQPANHHHLSQVHAQSGVHGRRRAQVRKGKS